MMSTEAFFKKPKDTISSILSKLSDTNKPKENE